MLEGRCAWTTAPEQRSLSANDRTSSFDLDICSQSNEFLHMHKAILEDIFNDDASAFRLRSECHELRLRVRREARVLFGGNIGSLQCGAVAHDANAVRSDLKFHAALFRTYRAASSDAQGRIRRPAGLHRSTRQQ